MNQYIVSKPGFLGGSPHIAGHRIRVLDIVVWSEKRGYSPDQIVDLFPGLTLAEVHAALVYYFDHMGEIEAEIQKDHVKVAEMRSHYSSKPSTKNSE